MEQEIREFIEYLHNTKKIPEYRGFLSAGSEQDGCIPGNEGDYESGRCP